MRFALSEDQDRLRRTVRRALDDAAVREGRRDLLTGDGFDHELWQLLAGDLGLAALTIPERHGGAGLGWVELVAVCEELGRSLAAVPYLSTVAMAGTALLVCGDETQRARWLPDIAEGRCRAALAWVGDVAATPSGDGWRLDGSARHVVDGHVADLLVVAAGDALYAIPSGTPGLRCRRVPTVDLTRPRADVGFDGVVAPASARLAGADLRAVLERAAVALAGEQVGGADACLAMSVDYAGVRRQFGRPIGSFQAVQHMCADMFVRVESARSAAYYAAWVADHRPDELGAASLTAAAYCGDAFVACAGDTIQVHGGVGFTWEHDAHLYFKRARASRELLDGPRERHERVAAAIGLGEV